MKVREIMTKDVESCDGHTDLANAAMIMWRKDCGIVPVVEPDTREVVGVITDRDICMAVATRHQRPDEIEVDDVISGKLHAVAPEDNVSKALDLMREMRVRRLPVVDAAGQLAGIVSLMDLVELVGLPHEPMRTGVTAAQIVEVLKAIHGAQPTEAPAAGAAPGKESAGATGTRRKE
jgi:CBS domain-containing protein